MKGVKISSDVLSLRAEAVRLRRHFHEQPETGFEEFETAKFIAAYLKGLGLEVRERIAKTGVVGLLGGTKPGKTILYRSDMDALRVQEESRKPYRSKKPGIAHACGHDAHMAIALTLAKLFSRQRETLPGNIKFVFQPNEELAPGGAAPMIEQGVLENPHADAALGLHVWQELPIGAVGIKPGPVFAAVDVVSISVRGKGGHGALPHRSVDPVLVSAHLISVLEVLTSREIDPLKSAVLTFGSIHAGDPCNVIPEFAHLKGTFRCFDRKIRRYARKRIREICVKTAGCFGARCDVAITPGFPPLVNDPAFTRIVLEAARGVVPEKNIDQEHMTMGSEDMSLFLARVPGCYFFLGSANSTKGITYPHHSPQFDIDEDALLVGLEIARRTIAMFLSMK